jgi:hypothetical protein
MHKAWHLCVILAMLWVALVAVVMGVAPCTVFLSEAGQGELYLQMHVPVVAMTDRYRLSPDKFAKAFCRHMSRPMVSFLDGPLSSVKLETSTLWLERNTAEASLLPSGKPSTSRRLGCGPIQSDPTRRLRCRVRGAQ